MNNINDPSAIVSKFNLYLQALNASNSGVIITDNSLEDNPIIYCNKAFEKITGYSHDEIIGHNCRFLQSNDRSQLARHEIKDALALEVECRVEIRNYKKNGDLFWNELYISPVKNDKGVTTNYIGVQNDITGQKKADHDLREQKASVTRQVEERTRQLQENEIFLASIIQTVREGLLVLDGDFNVLSANNFFLNTFKVSSEETIGKVLYKLGNNQWDIPALRDLLFKILPTSNPVLDFQVEHDFPHIGKKTMLLNAYRIEFEGQYKDRILLAIEDITERREIERRKDDFLSIASHELKTPLTTIKGLVQLLQRFKRDKNEERFISTLDKVSLYIDRLNDLITELLDTSKIRSGNIESHKEVLNISQLIKDCVENISFLTPSHDIKISGLPEAIVFADESQITQVINNIISNAIKYSPESANIDVFISKVSNFIKVSVRDYGMGISQPDQLKIFERFFRAGSTQKKYPGMGIGLYISHEIVKNHKSTLWVESEINQGSVFSFTLPVDNEKLSLKKL